MGKLANIQKDSEDRFHYYCHASFFNLVNDGLVILDLLKGPWGEYIEVNDVFCDVLGYERSELIGLSPVDITPEDIRQDVELFIKRQKEGVGRKTIREIIFLSKNGRRIPTELTAHVVDLNGRLVGFGIHHDITKRKEFEQNLLRSYEKELRLRQKLQSQIQQRIEFARGLVHEIETSFTPILCNSKMLVETVSDETSHSLAQNIFRSAMKLNHRVDEHYDLIRGEVGMLELEHSWVSPSNLLTEIVSGFECRALLDKKLFQPCITPDLPTIWADENRLSQIIINLIDNAFKFTTAGAEIFINAYYDNSNLFIKVEDDGFGISCKDRAKIFQPYYRSRSKTIKAGGLGLGLALCKYLAELHGGDLRVRSNKPRGSIFELILPYSSNENL